jgi:hypothetical protein
MRPMQFNRNASVIIVKKGGSSLNLEGFNVRFDILKTNTRSTNNIEINIFNLAEATRNQIQEVDDKVILKVGYGVSADEIIAIGNIIKIVHHFEFPNVITRIEAKDGIGKLREVRGSLSFKAGTPVLSVLNAVTKKLGIDKRAYNFPIKGEFTNGFAFSGQMADALDKVITKAGLTWTVQNDELQINDKKGISNYPIVSVSKDTGMIGSPEKQFKTDGQLINVQANRGWRIKALLNPLIEPGGRILISSNTANGLFKVDAVKHTGELRGSDWFSLIDTTVI